MNTTDMLTKIKEHLAVNGNSVWVSTVYRQTKYTAKHSDLFFVSKDGFLCAKQGKGSVRLVSPNTGPLVSITLA